MKHIKEIIPTKSQQPKEVAEIEKICKRYFKTVASCFTVTNDQNELYNMIAHIQINWVYGIEKRIFNSRSSSILSSQLEDVRSRYYKKIDKHIKRKLWLVKIINSNEPIMESYTKESAKFMTDLLSIESNRDERTMISEAINARWENFKDYYETLLNHHTSERTEAIHLIKIKFMRLEDIVDRTLNNYDIPVRSIIEMITREPINISLTQQWTSDKKHIDALVIQWRKLYTSCTDINNEWNSIMKELRKLYLHVLAKRYHPDRFDRALSEEEKKIFSFMSNYLKEITNNLKSLYLTEKNSDYNIEKRAETTDEWWNDNIKQAISEQKEIQERLNQQKKLLETQNETMNKLMDEWVEIRLDVDELVEVQTQSSNSAKLINQRIVETQAKSKDKEELLDTLLLKVSKIKRTRNDHPKTLNNRITHKPLGVNL